MKYSLPGCAAVFYALALSSSAEARAQSAELWRTGALDAGPTAFGQIVDIAASPEGNLYVLDGLNRSVKILSSSGAFLAEFGREGGGPGEFRSPASVGFVAEHFWVFDPGRQDVQFFFEDSLVAVTRTPTADLDGDGRSTSLTIEAVSGDGPRASLRYLAKPFINAFDVAHGRATTGVTIGIDSPFDGIDTVAVQTLTTRMGHVPPRNDDQSQAGYFFRQPLAHSDITRSDSRGARILFVSRTTDGAARLAVYDNMGSVIARLPVAWTGTPLTSEIWGALVEREVQPLAARLPVLGAGTSAQLREMLEKALYKPERIPAVLDAIVGADRSIWLAAFSDPATLEWRRVDIGSGEVERRLLLPANAQVLEADEDGILAVVLGDFDEQYVARFGRAFVSRR